MPQRPSLADRMAARATFVEAIEPTERPNEITNHPTDPLASFLHVTSANATVPVMIDRDPTLHAAISKFRWHFVNQSQAVRTTYRSKRTTRNTNDPAITSVLTLPQLILWPVLGEKVRRAGAPRDFRRSSLRLVQPAFSAAHDLITVETT